MGLKLTAMVRNTGTQVVAKCRLIIIYNDARSNLFNTSFKNNQEIFFLNIILRLNSKLENTSGNTTWASHFRVISHPSHLIVPRGRSHFLIFILASHFQVVFCIYIFSYLLEQNNTDRKWDGVGVRLCLFF